MPNEETAAAKASESGEPSSLLTTLFTGLDLPEICGHLLASIVMFRELLPALAKAGVLETAQVEDMLTNASTKIDEVLHTVASDRPHQAGNIATTKEHAQLVLDGFRARLTKASPDH